MTIHVKDGGTWKEASLYVKDGGTWKTVNEAYIKDSGTWKQFFMNRVTVNITISANTTNYTLNTAKASGYIAGKTDVVLTIDSGVTVYSTSTGSYAFTVDNSWASGDTVTIVNNGTILGKGGDGGASNPDAPGDPGSSGGGAIYVQRAVSINNINRIAGGGGGGGGAAGSCSYSGKSCIPYRTGGGGGGIGNGAGGFGSPSGTAGTLTAAGSGGINGGYRAGNGGTYGTSGSNANTGAAGGAAGAAVVGNSNITWIATGTRNGSIS